MSDRNETNVVLNSDRHCNEVEINMETLLT